MNDSDTINEETFAKPLSVKQIFAARAYWIWQCLPVFLGVLGLTFQIAPESRLSEVLGILRIDRIYDEVMFGQITLLSLAFILWSKTGGDMIWIGAQFLCVLFFATLWRNVISLEYLPYVLAYIQKGEFGSFVFFSPWWILLPLSAVPYVFGAWLAKKRGLQLQTSLRPRKRGIVPVLIFVVLFALSASQLLTDLGSIPLVMQQSNEYTTSLWRNLFLEKMILYPASTIVLLIYVGIACRVNDRSSFSDWGKALAFAIAANLLLTVPHWYLQKTFPQTIEERLMELFLHCITPSFLAISWFLLSLQGYRLSPQSFPWPAAPKDVEAR